MIISYIIIFCLLFLNAKVKLKEFNNDYLSKETCLSIKGFFVILVFLRHFKQYVQWNDFILDRLFIMFDSALGQLIVVMFFFYSGYGIVKQIERSKEEYIKPFLKRRFLPVYIQFAICVLFFLLLNIIIDGLSKYTLLEIILSFTGWTSIGNSNWFMFVTFALYLFVFFSFRVLKFKDIKWNIVIFTILSIGLVIVLFFFQKPHWWNTLLCFALGMWFGYYKEKIDWFMKESKHYWLITIPLILVFLAIWFVYLKVWSSGYLYIVLAFLFALVVTTVTMKVQIGNIILDFFGKHVFSIYILQRIPMIFFKEIIGNVYLYFLTTFILTLIISVGFDLVFNKIRGLLNSRTTGKACAK